MWNGGNHRQSKPQQSDSSLVRDSPMTRLGLVLEPTTPTIPPSGTTMSVIAPRCTAAGQPTSFAAQWIRFMAQSQTPCRQHHYPRPLFRRAAHSATSASKHPQAPTTTLPESTPAQWTIPRPAHPAIESAPRISSKTIHPQDTPIKNSGAATVAPGFIPEEPDPNKDYWKLYQDTVNSKGLKAVTNAELSRLSRWLTSKRMTKELATKLQMIIKEMRKRDLQVNVDYYNDLLYFNIKRGKPLEAEKVLTTMETDRKTMVQSQRTIALLLALYLKTGDQAQLDQLLDRSQNGVAHYFAQFLQWTRGLLTEDQIKTAENHFRELQSNRCPPNSKRFTHLMESLFAAEKPQEVVGLIHHILDLGYALNEYTITSATSGLVRAGHYNDVALLWRRLGDKAEEGSDISALNSLLASMSRQPRQIKITEGLWERMLENPMLQPNQFSFASMMNGYFRAKDATSAMKLWEVMQKEPFSIRPNLVLYNSAMTGLFYNHQPEAAKALYEEMVGREDMSPLPLDTYRILIRGLLSVRDGDALAKVFARMEDSGVEADATVYTIIADVMFSQRDLIAATRATALMASLNIPKTAITYSAIIAGLVKSGQVKEAHQVYEEMQQAGYQPSVHTYGALIQGAFRAQDVAQAEELTKFAKMTKEGMSVGAYSIMIGGYARLRLLDQAEAWLGELRQLRQKIPWTTFYTLLKACVDEREWDAAERVIGAMEEVPFESHVPRLSQLIREVARVRAGGVPRAKGGGGSRGSLATKLTSVGSSPQK